MLDAVIKGACQYACAKLKNVLEPSGGQFSLPAEISALLSLPERNDPSLLKEILSVVIGTRQQGSVINHIENKLKQQNAAAGNAQLPVPNLYPMVFEIMKENQAKRAVKPEKKPKTAADRHKAAAEKKKETEEDASHALADDAAVEDEDDEALIYQSYRSKVIVGKKHPDPIVETASLASVDLPPPTYQHKLGSVANEGIISDAQLETIVYANMRFQQKIEGGATGGFFLGDGAGVGKGRQIGALILDHYRMGGRRTLWISVSNDLRFDAERDLRDVGASSIKVWPKGNNPMPKGRIDSHFREGVLFITYSLLVSNSKAMKHENPQTAMEANHMDASICKGSRLEQIVDWLKGEQAPLVVLDECHKAKNLIAAGGKSTQTGKAILKLQMNVPGAKVLYSSATGASEPNNLAYMTRLGSCGYKNMTDLVTDLNQSGLGSLEMFSMGLKATGCYLSRTLSYKGAEFQIAKVKMDPVFKVMYNRACEFWHLLSNILTAIPKPGKKAISQFYSAQQRFFRQMLMAAKVPETARIALEAVANDFCVVIGLQSTGEANTTSVREKGGDQDLDDFVSAPQQILLLWLSNHFPVGHCTMTDGKIQALQTEVYFAIEAWKKVLPAKEQAKLEEDIANERKAANERANKPGPQGSFHQRAASRAVEAESDEDDEPHISEALTLDQAIEREHQEQKLAGKFIDLDAVPLEKVQKAQQAIKKEEEKEERKKVKEEQDKKKKAQNLLQDAVNEAKSQVKKCEDELKQIRRAVSELMANQGHDSDGEQGFEPDTEMQDAEGAGAGQPGAKRLRKKSGVGPGLDSLSSGESDDEKTLINRKRTIAATSDDEDNSSSLVIRGDSLNHAKKPRNAKSASVIIIGSDSDDDEVTSPSKKPAAKDLQTRARLCDMPAPCQTKREENLSDKDDFEVEDDDVIICDEDAQCKKCGSKECDEDDMLICSNEHCGANGAYHLRCLDPPLNDVPEGDWFCPNCEDKQAATAPQGSRQTTLTFGKNVNKGVLHMQEAAAKRRLENAVRDLKGAEQKRDRELRLQDRQTNGRAEGQAKRARNAVPVHDSGSDEDMDNDSDFEIEEETTPQKKAHNGRIIKEDPSLHQKRPVGKVDPGAANGKPGKARRNGEYRYHVNLTDLEKWEEEVNALEQPPANDLDKEHPGMVKIREMLCKIVTALELPANPLDQLTEMLGGAARVAEMTGRKGQLIRAEEGRVLYQHRRANDNTAQKDVNMREKMDFMQGKKLIAIISDAASTGISLQADKRVANQRRRCHLTLELPWSADKAIQQFGRSHRSNQTSAPLYRIIVTECAGEFRFAASAAKRLQSLGALLKGDRRALGAGHDLKEFDCDNRYGLIALKRIFGDILGTNSSAMPGVELPEIPDHLLTEAGVTVGHKHAFYDYIKPKMVQVGMLSHIGQAYGCAGFKEELNVSKKVSTWLNRVLAMTLFDQEKIFKYFNDTYEACINVAKSKGQYDSGIMSILAYSIKQKAQKVIHTDEVSGAVTYHTELQLDRGCPWATALESRNAVVDEMKRAGQGAAKSGFYISRRQYNAERQHYILLATEQKRQYRNASNRVFRIRRPHMDASLQLTEGDLAANYTRVRDDKKAERIWNYWFELTGKGCMHNPCKAQQRPCRHGARKQSMHLISGAILPILQVMYQTVNTSGFRRERDGKKANPKVYRAKLDDGSVVVGMEVHEQEAIMLAQKIEHGDEMNPGMPIVNRVDYGDEDEMYPDDY